jgi:hypothetical protein
VRADHGLGCDDQAVLIGEPSNSRVILSLTRTGAILNGSVPGDGVVLAVDESFWLVQGRAGHLRMGVPT